MTPTTRTTLAVAGTGVALAAVVVLLVKRDAIIAAALLSPPSSPAPNLPPPGEEPKQLAAAPALHLEPARTYFAVVQTSGVVSAAASPARVEAEARKLGFRDVFVSEKRPASFPGRATGSYYVRATYAGAPRDVAREKSVFLGGVKVIDAWIASA